MSGGERVAIIGGTGLYRIDGVEDLHEERMDTPFGAPSDALITGRLKGVDVVFLPRHGRGHRWSPTNIPVRANIWALKALGVTRIFSVSAVGSMRPEVRLTEPVLIDQFIDMTRDRKNTFFDEGIVAHVSMAHPTCDAMRTLLQKAASHANIAFHAQGTYVCMEGPQFSSRAESMMYRAMGVDVIGMTNAPEAKLAREAEMCYCTIALPTDYDCWHEEEDDVSVGSVIQRLEAGTDKARRLVSAALEQLDDIGPCTCRDALRGAILTDPALIDGTVKDRLGPLVGRYL